MKFECIRDNLRQALESVERVATKQTPLLILNSLILEAKKNTLTIKATNLDLGVEYSLPVKVEKQGICAIQSGVLVTFISNINSSTPLNFELIGTQLHISSPRHSTSIKTTPFEDFPRIPRVESKDIIGTFHVSGTILTSGIRSVQSAAAITDIKPEIAAIYMEHHTNELIFVATDMFRLAEKSIKLEDKEKKGGDKKEVVGEPLAILIPTSNAGETARSVESAGEMKVSFSKTEVMIESRELYIFSRLVAGPYLNYKQAIPTHVAPSILISKEELQGTLRAGSVFTDAFHQVHIRIIPDEKLCEITSKNQDTGESVGTPEVRGSGESIEGNFNARFIIDGLQAILGDTLELLFAGKDKPMLIQGYTDHSLRYIVAPLNRS